MLVIAAGVIVIAVAGNGLIIPHGWAQLPYDAGWFEFEITFKPINYYMLIIPVSRRFFTQSEKFFDAQSSLFHAIKVATIRLWEKICN